MAGGKLPPRQKMINMMYLVLTALLAMNVSKDILEAFVIINEGLEQTNAAFENKNGFIYNQFEQAKLNDPIKVTPFYKKAMQAKKLADELDNYMESLKLMVIKAVDAGSKELPDDSVALKKVQVKDNYDIPTYMLIGEDPSKPKNTENSARELKEKIALFRDDLLNLIEDPKVRANMDIGLRTDDFEAGEIADEGESWEVGWFYHIPLAAVVTGLSKFQSDVRNAEADIISTLYANIDAGAFKFDTLAAKVIPNSRYIFSGDSYKAEILVAAFSTTQDPYVELGDVDDSGRVKNPDTTSVRVSRGVATYAIVPRTEGKTEWGGVIKLKAPDGTMKPFYFKDMFEVMKPATVISPTAMNVFYRGLDNPVSVSVSGIASEKLRVSCSNGTISPKNKNLGEYTVQPGEGKECIVTVGAEVEGKVKNFGTGQTFRVKNVPPPIAKFGEFDATKSKAPLAKVKSAIGVFAVLEGFVFDGVKFTVTNFKLSTLVKGQLVEREAKSASLTQDMKDLIKNLKGGQKLFIEEIKAKGPAGPPVDLSPIILKVVG